MFKKLHVKLTAYMGLVLVLFICFVAMGIYNFTRVVFENSNKELMNAEALRINALIENKLSAKSALEDENLIKLVPRMAFLTSERLEACYIVYNDKFDRIYIKNGEIEVADAIKDFAINSI